MTMVPPLSMWLYIARPGHRTVRLWLPLFLIWLILLPLWVLTLAIALVVDSVLWLAGRKYHHYTLLLLRCCGVLADTRGLVVRVNADEATVDVTVS